ncbi:Rid family detoxifying hydrolase [Desulfuromonas thiophila]|uniref:Endoribonuclease L-PSP n=1 Tax=Desulfuromonas thiophila TaxID=57664 RepID=A0A1G7DTK7_9BACT|nr:Rid family detoxifying hydrolase [Desulfuromonas thiophila]SDE54818.1 endoribonuclease L-PSP [Desulfuromonas thiophila]
MKQVISSPAAPAAIGPYSPAIAIGDTVYFSGQIPLDPVSGELVNGGIEAQTRQVLANLQALFSAAGVRPEQVVKTTVYLTDLADFATVNALYGELFGPPAPPARVCIQVAALPKGAAIEIDCIASRQA